MQCPCGGRTAETHADRKRLDMRLELHTCTACGRVRKTLFDFHRTRILAREQEAARLWRDATGDTSD